MPDGTPRSDEERKERHEELYDDDPPEKRKGLGMHSPGNKTANIDWDGWNRVIESNGYPREWDNDRIMRGTISGQEEDQIGDTVHLSAFLTDKSTDGKLTRIEWLCKHGVISLIHGMTEIGFIPLGQPLAWKTDGNKIKILSGINKGSEMVDHLWNNYLSKEEEAGFSIGGQDLQKECHTDTLSGKQKCDIFKTDLWEIAWTPKPMYKGAIIDFVNKLAKSGTDSLKQLADLNLKTIEQRDGKWCTIHCEGEKRGETIACFDTKEEALEQHRAIEANKSKMIKALLNYKEQRNISSSPPISELLAKCEPTQKYLEALIKSGSNYINSLETLSYIANETFEKSGVCYCIECGFSYLTNVKCVGSSCPVCGGDLHAMVRPDIKSGGIMDDKKVTKAEEDEEKLPPKKEESGEPEEKLPPKEEKAAEDNGEDKDEDKEEPSIKSVITRLETLEKAIETHSLLFKDLKKDQGVDDDTNTVEEKKETGSGDPNPGGEVSGKSETSELKKAVEIIQKSGLTVNGLSVGAPKIRPISEIGAPSGIDTLKKSRSITDIVRQKLKIISGTEPDKAK